MLVYFLFAFGIFMAGFSIKQSMIQRDRRLRELDRGRFPQDVLEGLANGKQWYTDSEDHIFSTGDGWKISLEKKVYTLSFRDPQDTSLTRLVRYKNKKPDALSMHAIYQSALSQQEARQQLAQEQKKAKESEDEILRAERMRQTLTDNRQDGELSMAGEDFNGDLSLGRESPDET